MTCIVALKHDDGKIWMAWDSGRSAGEGAYHIIKEDKVSTIFDGKIVVGIAGAAAIGMAVKYELENYLVKGYEKLRSRDEAERLLEDPVAALTVWFNRAYNEMIHELEFDDPERYWANLLIVYKGRIFIRDQLGGIAEPAKEYVAIGSGCSEAEGALYALKYSDVHGARKVEIAVEAAIARDTYIKGPIRVKQVYEEHINLLEIKGDEA